MLKLLYLYILGVILCAVVFFNDDKCAFDVMDETDPRRQKQIAKDVKDFNETEWNKVSKAIVKAGSMAKVCLQYKKLSSLAPTGTAHPSSWPIICVVQNMNCNLYINICGSSAFV